jgi:hypothetical protein
LRDKAGELGLATVAYGDENLLGQYPAVKVVSGLMNKQLHATRQWLNDFNIDIWVYHAKLVESHAQRSREDLLLTSAIRAVLHEDMTMGGGVIQGWVIQEMPALIPRSKGNAIVGTRMVWNGNQRQAFS